MDRVRTIRSMSTIKRGTLTLGKLDRIRGRSKRFGVVHRPPTLARLEEAARLAAMITGNFEEHARSLSDETQSTDARLRTATEIRCVGPAVCPVTRAPTQPPLPKCVPLSPRC